jgi:hypothetical protein
MEEVESSTPVCPHWLDVVLSSMYNQPTALAVNADFIALIRGSRQGKKKQKQ